MATHRDRALSYAGLFVLQALARGHGFGFDIMEVTGLPSGTIYPALRRLEAFELVRSDWEPEYQAHRAGRPRRRYYELTAAGRRRLQEAEARYRALGALFPDRSVMTASRPPSQLSPPRARRSTISHLSATDCAG